MASKVIELIGHPGSGKTAFCRYATRQHSHKSPFTLHAKEDLLLRWCAQGTRHLGWKQRLYLLLLSGLSFLPPAAKERIVRTSVPHIYSKYVAGQTDANGKRPAAMAQAFVSAICKHGSNDQSFLLRVHWLTQHLMQLAIASQFLKNADPERDLLLVDEGLLQRGLSLMAEGAEYDDIRHYIDKTPEPFAIIYVDAPVATCRRRLPKDKRRTDLLDVSSLAEERMKMLLDILAASPSFPPVIRIDGTQDTAHMYREVMQALDRQTGHASRPN